MPAVDTTPKVGDVGTSIEITVVEWDDALGDYKIVDVSRASLVLIKWRKPDNSPVVTKIGEFVTDGTDGKVRYVTLPGDIDQAGPWQVEAEIYMDGGQWSTDIYKMRVGRSL